METTEAPMGRKVRKALVVVALVVEMTLNALGGQTGTPAVGLDELRRRERLHHVTEG